MSNFWFIVVISIVVIHFIAGFGYLFYKLSAPPKKKEEEAKDA